MSYCPTGAAGSHRSSTWPCPRGSLGRGDQDLRRDPTRPGPRGQLDPGDRTPALPSPEPDTATYAHVRTIEPLARGVPVEGRVAFAGNARPKGMADGVCHVSDLTEELRSLCQERVSTALDDAWARIPRATPSDRAARLEHLEGLRAGHGRVRGAWFPAVVFVVSVVWMIGLGLYQRPMARWPDGWRRVHRGSLMLRVPARTTRPASRPSSRRHPIFNELHRRLRKPARHAGHGQLATAPTPTEPRKRRATIESATPATARAINEDCASATGRGADREHRRDPEGPGSGLWTAGATMRASLEIRPPCRNRLQAVRNPETLARQIAAPTCCSRFGRRQMLRRRRPGLTPIGRHASCLRSAQTAAHRATLRAHQ